MLTQNNTNKEEHEFDIASRRTFFFQHRALFGMLVLTLGMGLGRFLYTPMLPVMLAEGEFSFSELSWIASGNYAGHLAGSLLFSFGAFHLPSACARSC